MENEAKKPLELYIHVPFCVKKCDYCDFLSGPAGKESKKMNIALVAVTSCRKKSLKRGD